MRYSIWLCALAAFVWAQADQAAAQGRCMGSPMGRSITPYYPMYYPTYTPYYPNYTPNYGNYQPYTYSPASNSLSKNFDLPGGKTARPKRVYASAPVKSKSRVSDDRARAKAEESIALADENFGNERYAAAAEQYKSAVRLAPDLGDPYFRLGFTLVAQGRYVAAVKSFRHGLEIQPQWTDSPFRLKQIYAAATLAKMNQSLREEVEAKGESSDLLIALGMQLFFSGERERARTYFEQAARLGANKDRLFDNFLPQPALAEVSKKLR